MVRKHSTIFKVYKKKGVDREKVRETIIEEKGVYIFLCMFIAVLGERERGREISRIKLCNMLVVSKCNIL